MPEIVFERLKVSEKKKIIAGTSDSGCPSVSECSPLSNLFNSCCKTIVSGCSLATSRVCIDIDNESTGE